MVTPELHVTNPEQLADLLFRRFELAIQQCFENNELCHVVLSGGSTGEMLFPKLRLAKFPWSRMHFYWGDERAVPLNHPDSNFHQAQSLWLNHVEVPRENLHPIDARLETLEQDAQRYEGLIFDRLATRRSFDVAALGVGPDAHVCSLFPEHELLEEKKRWVAAVHDSPKKPAARISLTLPALATTQRTLVCARGRAKRSAISEALKGGSLSPLARLLAVSGGAELVLDREAAGEPL